MSRLQKIKCYTLRDITAQWFSCQLPDPAVSFLLRNFFFTRGILIQPRLINNAVGKRSIEQQRPNTVDWNQLWLMARQFYKKQYLNTSEEILSYKEKKLSFSLTFVTIYNNFTRRCLRSRKKKTKGSSCFGPKKIFYFFQTFGAKNFADVGSYRHSTFYDEIKTRKLLL